MKSIFLKYSMILAAGFLAACTPEQEEGSAGAVSVSTDQVSEISAYSAQGSGAVTSKSGSASVSERGLCWSTSQNPTTADYKKASGKGLGEFSAEISPVEAGTTYYVRAYAVSLGKTTYGNSVSFTTDEVSIKVTTSAITEITKETALGGGSVNSDSGEAILEAGLCWNTTGLPTVENDSYTVEDLGSDGSFTSELTNLDFNTTYYVRAYARTASSIGYGNEVTFITVAESVVEMPDQHFKNYMLQNFDTNKDGFLQFSEAEAVTEINLSGLSNITDIEGVKSCTNLLKLFVGTTDESLVAAGTFNTLASVDVSGLSRLEELWLTQTGISSLNTEDCTGLKTMHALKNNLTSLDLSSNTALVELHLNGNPLTSLNLENQASLKNLGIIKTQITSIDLSGKTSLWEVFGADAQLETVNLEGCTGLNGVYVNNNKITEINVKGCTTLKQIHAVNNRLNTIDLSDNRELTDMHLNENQLTAIDLSANVNLLNIGLINNQISSIDLSHNKALLGAWVAGNPITTLDLSDHAAMHTIEATNCQSLQTVNLSACPAMANVFFKQCPELTGINLSECAFVMTTVHLNESGLQSIIMKQGQTVSGEFLRDVEPEYVD